MSVSEVGSWVLSVPENLVKVWETLGPLLSSVWMVIFFTPPAE